MVQRALDELEGEPIDVYAVWIPAIGGDRYEATANAMTLIPDARVRHYWDGGQALGEALAPAIGIRAQLAWDVYLVYDASVAWGDAAPAPTPTSWLHQKAGEDPEYELNEEKLVEQLRAALK